MMETRSLTPELDVPVVGLGTSKTLEAAEEKEPGGARHLVTAALDAGVRLIDTSPMYGQAEALLAQALTGQRDRAIVVTKIWNEDAAAAKDQTLRVVESFGGWLDVLLVHNLMAWERHLPFLHDLRDQGVVKAIGFSHWQDEAWPEALRAIQSGEFEVAELPYNPTWRSIESELLPALSEKHMAVLALRPLGQGHLVDRVAAISEDGGYGPAQRLLRWALGDPRITCVIPATSRLSSLVENAAAGEPPWPTEAERERLVRELEELERNG